MTPGNRTGLTYCASIIGIAILAHESGAMRSEAAVYLAMVIGIAMSAWWGASPRQPR